VRRLARHSLVFVGRGFEANDDAVIEVKPLVEKVLPDDRIQEIAERIRAYASAKIPVAAPEQDVDAESEPHAGSADPQRGTPS
jgi:hypothetical protein